MTNSHSSPCTHQSSLKSAWRLGLGAEVTDQGVRFRVWAPKRRRVDVEVEGQGLTRLERDEEGYFAGLVPEADAGRRYRYRLDGQEAYPDPCSRFQPDGPHDASLIVDPFRYRWHDAGWPGVRMHGQVIYELHVGAFTADGTLDAAARELETLRQLGITLIELMPLAEFPGRWNWGYDGVALYAPAHVYGDQDALRRFVDAAHGHGLGVVLDVVYNHLGPDGNYLSAYSDDYFTDRYKNQWGQAVNFDGPHAREVREFFIRNACYWITEFHLDGLRLDATQQMFDASDEHVLKALTRRTRAAAGARSIVLIAENEPQDLALITPTERGGYGLDAVWIDDFHHITRVALTGRREAYYTDYRGSAQELVSVVKRSLLYQGQRYAWQDRPRGAPVGDQPTSAFVFYLQNHDQVANHPCGTRLHALSSPSRFRALTAVLLLAPQTPMLFMGQEYGASAPFVFFADHRDGLASIVHGGRREFLTQFPSYATREAQATVPDPADPLTFEQCKLEPAERDHHASISRLHGDLLRLRRDDPVMAAQRRDRLDGACLGDAAFVIRFFSEHGDRLLVVNLGVQFSYDPAPEPLLAPPRPRRAGPSCGPAKLRGTAGAE